MKTSWKNSRELLDRYEEDLDSEEESWDLKIDRAGKK